LKGRKVKVEKRGGTHQIEGGREGGVMKKMKKILLAIKLVFSKKKVGLEDSTYGPFR